MKKVILRIFVLLIFVSAVYAGATGPSGVSEAEPAGKFIPTEKLRADDSVDFPVDI